MKTLYLECETGISGDMIVGMLLDLGADQEVLKKALSKIEDDSFKIEIKRVNKSGIDCCDFNVILDDEHENHDHDMEYLYGHEHNHDCEHHHEHDHGHEPHHEHEHCHEHHHIHRNLADIEKIISKLEITENAKNIALKTFKIIAEAEAKAHNKAIDEVHFHEVGAIDSIIDIVSASVCFDNLEIKDVIVPKLCEGTGSVRCQHGILPVPVPAVMNIISKYNLPLSITERKGELLTPTGVAFVASVITSTSLPEIIKPVKIGLGSGKREYKQPSILRGFLLEENSQNEKDFIWKLECNIDDSTGEQLGYTMEKLFAEGARDVFYTPIFMKKNRPAYLLSVITDDENVSKMEDIIFNETTTIGIRKQKMERSILPRKTVDVKTKYGNVKIKVCEHLGQEKIYPEYESVAKIAKENNKPFDEIFKTAIFEYKK